MATNPQSLAKQRESLYDQIRSASRQQAQQSYQTGLSALRNQMQQQRLNMNQSRGQISEQAYMTQRGIQNQAQARGLGSSGLTNLANFQAQQQAGQAVSNLEQQNQMVQSEAMNVRRGLINELSQATRGADLSYAQQMAESDERAFQQEQAIRDSNINFLSTISNMAIDNRDLAEKLAGIYYGGGEINEDTVRDIVDSADTINQYDPTLMEKIGLGGSAENRKRWADVQEIGGGALTTLSMLAMLVPGFQPVAAAGVATGLGSRAMASNSDIWRERGNQTYTIEGNEIATTSRDDAKQQVTQALSQKYSQIASGAIKVDVGRFGHVTFTVGDAKKKYNTLGAATQALRDKIGQQ